MLLDLVFKPELLQWLLHPRRTTSNMEAAHLRNRSSTLHQLLIGRLPRARRPHHLLVGQAHLNRLLRKLLLHMEKISLHLPLVTLHLLTRIRRHVVLLDLRPVDRILACLLLWLAFLVQEDLSRLLLLAFQSQLAPLALECLLVHLSAALL